jgi:hypothetical protein
MTRTAKTGTVALGSGLRGNIDAEQFEAYSGANATRGSRTEAASHWVFYIGLGDQFDDDRRLVRTADLVR